MEENYINILKRKSGDGFCLMYHIESDDKFPSVGMGGNLDPTVDKLIESMNRHSNISEQNRYFPKVAVISVHKGSIGAESITSLLTQQELNTYAEKLNNQVPLEFYAKTVGEQPSQYFSKVLDD